MANLIKVETGRLRSAATQFASTSSQIKSATNSMTAAVGQLSGAVWSGEAAATYVSKFNQLNDEIMRIDNMIKEHVSDLNMMADEYDKAEAENKETASALQSELF